MNFGGNTIQPLMVGAQHPNLIQFNEYLLYASIILDS